MTDQIVITEKTSQAKDVRAAVGSRYGDILPAEGHLFDLLEPEDVVPAWKRWSPILLRTSAATIDGHHNANVIPGTSSRNSANRLKQAATRTHICWARPKCLRFIEFAKPKRADATMRPSERLLRRAACADR